MSDAIRETDNLIADLCMSVTVDKEAPLDSRRLEVIARLVSAQAKLVQASQQQELAKTMADALEVQQELNTIMSERIALLEAHALHHG